MFFVFVIVGLTLLVAFGLYVRHRLADALAQVGVAKRPVKIVRWMLAWLLYGYPVILIGAIVVSRLLDYPTIPRLDGFLGSWLLGIPFIISVLVVFQATPWNVLLTTIQ